MKRMLLSLGPGERLLLTSPGGKSCEVEQKAAPAVTFLLIDCSTSMVGEKLIQGISGAQDFAEEAISRGYAVGVIRFSGDALILSKPQRSVNSLMESVRNLEANGSTNMTSALELAFSQLGHLDGERAVVLVTDGQPDDRKSTLGAARRMVAAGVGIITIGTDDADITFLRQLATKSELAIKVEPSRLSGGIASAARLLEAPRQKR